MNFIPKREFAIKALENFIESNLIKYSYERNFDYGITNRENTSCLSPYITHGLITEKEVIRKCLKRFSFSRIEKYIQEVLWRIYWKGWLEIRPEVWNDFKDDYMSLYNDYKENDKYLNAISGQTNIECFNEWVNELKTYNYLHNHTRMWFASIWIFTLQLPWQLGAAFFYEHLYDGDAASNTLGWRWVAGIQTKGKHYLAKNDNINKFSNKRFNEKNLNEDAKPIIDDREYKANIKKRENLYQSQDIESLILFDNHYYLEDIEKYTNLKKIYVPINLKRILPLSQNVIEFKNGCKNDFIQNLSKNNLSINEVKVDEISELESICSYPSIGENLDCLKNYSKLNKKFKYKEIDLLALPYCNKGFFNFKQYIPKILNQLS